MALNLIVRGLFMVKKSLFFGCVLVTTALLLFSGCPTSTDDTDDGKPADKTALTAAIEAAEVAVEVIRVDTAAANVPTGTEWVTQAVKDAYQAAIEAAQTAADKAEARQADIDSALAALTTATASFNAAKQQGTRTVSNEEVELRVAIEAAEEAVAAVIVDTAATNVPTGTEWVTQEVKDAYQAAIEAAQTAADTTGGASPEALVTALTALTSAGETFNAAKAQGTKSVAKDDLTTAIEAAEEAVAAVIVDTAATNVPTGTKWVIQEVKDTYEAAIKAAIKAAETVADTTTASQAEISEALNALLQAGNRFEAAQQEGSLFKDGLTGAIAAAEAAVAGITVNTNAANVAKGKQWVTQKEKEDYEAAIKAAKAVADKTDASQKEVNRALAALNDATQTFNEDKKEGINNPVVPEIVFDTTIILYHGNAPLSRNTTVTVPRNSTYEIQLAPGYKYTQIHWYINGTKQGYPDTVSTLVLPTGTPRTLVVSAEATVDGRIDTSGNYTFEVTE
jgi:tetratricopeptide (TPR) repeat protein